MAKYSKLLVYCLRKGSTVDSVIRITMRRRDGTGMATSVDGEKAVPIAI